MPKRKSSPIAVASTAPAAKKARKSAEDLVSHFTALQDAYRELEKGQSTALMKVSANVGKPEDDAAKVKEKAYKIADMMAAGIKKQMKWQPSCKTGGKRWAYEGMVPSEAVFLKLFNLKKEKKSWKQKKIPLRDFEDITGGLEASIRYGYLRVVSENVTLKWDKEALSFSVSGLYGL